MIFLSANSKSLKNGTPEKTLALYFQQLRLFLGTKTLVTTSVLLGPGCRIGNMSKLRKGREAPSIDFTDTDEAGYIKNQS